MTENPNQKIISAQPGPQTKFLECGADIVIFGGARGGGKTFALLMDAMRHCIGPNAVKGFNALLFRETYSEILRSGGLLTASERIYPYCDAKFTLNSMRWTFPSQATVDFGYMEHERDKEKYLGLELPWIGFDEVNKFSESQFWYLMSSNRSTLGVKSQIRATCNPDSASWVAKFIEWWIDQDTGWPIPERDGKIRLFVRVDNQLHWANTAQELWDNTKDFYDGDPSSFMPKSATFIRSLLSDNEILMERDPGYKATLLAQPRADRLRFLEGNWSVSATAGAEWEEYPEYFDQHIWTNHWPDAFESSAMFCDPSKGKSDKSDFSAIVFVGLSGGKIWIKSDIKRRPSEVITSDFVRLFHEWKPTFAGMENNVFQDLFDPLIDKECQLRGHPPLPLELVHNSVKKEVRIRSLGPYLQKQKFRLLKSCENNRLLYGQLKDFGVAEYDDGPDALEGALGLLQHHRIDTLDGSPETPLEAFDSQGYDVIETVDIV